MADKWKNELLLETLRAKSSKSFIELAKNTRLNLLERRYNIDAVEKQTLQTALDNLQNNIQIKSRSHFVEKLESITRRSLLKFTDNANTSSLFISSDMFYLEILLDPQSGKVNDVKVHHECSNSESDPHLVDVLRKGDFIDFTQHLEGFQSIYQLNAESKIKSKAFIAIQALESDIANIFNYESMTNAPPEALVLASSTGLVTKRRGGHPMKLLFFVRPTELLNFEKKRMDPLNSALQAAAAAKKSIGNNVTINLEAAAPSNKLQTAPLLVKNTKPEGGLTYNQINLHNSTMLPAVFVLRFNHGMPLNQQTVDDIKKITNNLGVFGDQQTAFKTELTTVEPASAFTPLVNLIINLESEGANENGQKGLFVTLADQSHCYFISDNNDHQGTVIKTIQFTEPSHITQIIKLLRQQALFNALIASCVRKHNSRQDFDCYMIEVNVVTMQFIQIFVQHPYKESIVTVEMDLSDIMHLSCKIQESDQKHDPKLENYITRVFQKTMSIPMVLRSLIKCWDKEALDYQRSVKRLSNNEIFGSGSKNDSKGNNDEGDKKDSSGKLNDDFVGSRQDTSGVYDICGINKNEIFLKASEPILDIFNQQHKSKSHMGFDLDENVSMPKRSDDLFESSMSPASNMSDGSRKSGLMFPSKAGTPTQKLMDVFDFNDPSPPPAASGMLPMQSPVGDSRKTPTPRASPSIDKKIEMMPIKSPMNSIEAAILGHSSLSITPVGNAPEFVYEKPKSEKKKKRKREDGDSSPSLTKKKSSDSLGSSPSKKSSSQLMGKPSASFKPKKSPLPGGAVDDYLSYGADQQTAGLPSPMRSPKDQSSKGSSQTQNNRKNSLSAVINKLKSEMTDTAPGGEDHKSEYQIKSSGSDGIKITFNKTKMSKGLKGSPKHTGLKPGVTSGPASKKSSQSSKSSQKLLYSKSNSSSSLEASNSAHLFKSSSQPGKSSSSSSKERSSDLNQFPSFSGSSNDMLKNMLNLASPVPRSDIMKAFDRKFQIPKLSARGKADEKPAVVEEPQGFNSVHPRSAPSTPLQSSTPSPTMDFMRDGSSSSSSAMAQQKFLPSPQQQKQFHDNSQSSKKLFKSVSSEQLFGEPIPKFPNDTRSGGASEISDLDFQAFLKSQSRKPEPSASVSMHLMKSPMHQLGMDGNMNQAAEANVFNENDLIDLNFSSQL